MQKVINISLHCLLLVEIAGISLFYIPIFKSTSHLAKPSSLCVCIFWPYSLSHYLFLHFPNFQSLSLLILQDLLYLLLCFSLTPNLALLDLVQVVMDGWNITGCPQLTHFLLCCRYRESAEAQSVFSSSRQIWFTQSATQPLFS